MRSHFIKYLHAMVQSSDPNIKKHLDNSRVVVNSVTVSGISSSVSRIINGFPDFADCHPYDLTIINKLTAEFHTSITAVNEGEEENQAIIDQHLTHMIDKMFNAACADVLDEKGNIHPSIVEMLNLNDMLAKFAELKITDVKEKFIIGVVTQIYIAAIFEKWRQEEAYQNQFFTNNINHTELLQNVNARIIKLLPENTKLQKSIGNIIKAELKLRPAVDISFMKTIGQLVGVLPNDADHSKALTNNLTLAMPELLQQITAFENVINKQAFINIVIEQFKTAFRSLCEAEPQKKLFTELRITHTALEKHLQSLITRLLVEHLNKDSAPILAQEIETHVNTALGNMTIAMMNLINGETNQVLKGKINDYQLYGKPIATNFNQTYFVDLCKEYGSAIFDADFWKNRTLTNNNPPMQQRLDELAHNFNFLLTTQAIEHFAIKLMFGAYAAVLNEKGRIKPEILAVLDTPLLEIQELKEKLITSFLLGMLSNILKIWCSKTDYKKDFLHNTTFTATTVTDTVADIVKKLAGDIMLDLNQVYGFPFTAMPRVSIESFTVVCKITAEQVWQAGALISARTSLERTKAAVQQIDSNIQEIKINTNQFADIITESDNLNKEIEKYREIFAYTPAYKNETAECTYWLSDQKYQLGLIQEILNELEHGSTFYKDGAHVFPVSNIYDIRKKSADAAIATFRENTANIQRFIGGLLQSRTEALADVQVLLDEYKLLLLDNSRFWGRRVKNPFGGVNAKFEDGEVVIPTRADAMRRFLLSQTQCLTGEMPADLTLFAILKIFAEETAKATGFLGFWRDRTRSNKSNELYDEVFTPAFNMTRTNLYDRTALKINRDKIVAFKNKYDESYHFNAHADKYTSLRNG